jgi:hypothetical protein
MQSVDRLDWASASLCTSRAKVGRLEQLAIQQTCVIGSVAFDEHPATVAQGFQPDSAQQKRPRLRRNGSCWFFLQNITQASTNADLAIPFVAQRLATGAKNLRFVCSYTM